MSKFKKNKTLGFIPSTQDRSPFQKRLEYLQGMSLLAQQIVYDYEKYFKGNIVLGNSFSQILNSFLVDYQAMLNNRTMDLSYWFDTSNFDSVYGLSSGGRDSEFFAQTFLSDLKYKSLIRSDKKLAPINFVLGNKTFSKGVVNERYFDCMTIQALWLYAVKLKSVTPTNLSNVIVPPNASGVNYVNEVSTSSGMTFGLRYYSGFEKTIGTTKMIDKENGFVLIDSRTNDWSIYNNVGTYSREGSLGYRANLNTTKNSSGVFSTTFTSSYYSPNEFIQALKDAIALIGYLELDNVALNIEGNYDGIKTDAYEQILNDQLSFLNNISDRVQNALINEKITGQNKKDELLLILEAKKKELNDTILNKKNNINKMNETIDAYNKLVTGIVS